MGQDVAAVGLRSRARLSLDREVGAEFIALAHGDGAVQQVLEFAHVAGQRVACSSPAMPLERRRHRHAGLVRNARPATPAQRGQVFTPFAQRRHARCSITLSR